jgi:hypothetical protein
MQIEFPHNIEPENRVCLDVARAASPWDRVARVASPWDRVAWAASPCDFPTHSFVRPKSRTASPCHTIRKRRFQVEWPERKHAGKHAAKHAGVKQATATQTGGLPDINRWLSDEVATQTGVLPDINRWLSNEVATQAGGLPDINRWLSDEVATPPDYDYSKTASRRDARMRTAPCLASQDAIFSFPISGGMVSLANPRSTTGQFLTSPRLEKQ